MGGRRGWKLVTCSRLVFKKAVQGLLAMCVFTASAIPLLVSVFVGVHTPHFSSDLSPGPGSYVSLSPSIIILSLSVLRATHVLGG